CHGCEAVHALLKREGLEKYYALRDGSRSPAAVQTMPAALPTIDAGRVVVGIEGLHCTACVWLCEELFNREPGAGGIDVNTTRGTLDLRVDAERFSLEHYAR